MTPPELVNSLTAAELARMTREQLMLLYSRIVDEQNHVSRTARPDTYDAYTAYLHRIQAAVFQT